MHEIDIQRLWLWKLNYRDFPIRPSLFWSAAANIVWNSLNICVLVSFFENDWWYRDEMMDTHSSVTRVPKLSIASWSSSLLMVPSLLWSNTRKAARTSSIPLQLSRKSSMATAMNSLLDISPSQSQLAWRQNKSFVKWYESHKRPKFNSFFGHFIFTFCSILSQHKKANKTQISMINNAGFCFITFMTISTISSSVGFWPIILKIYPTDRLGIWSKPCN